LRFLITTALGLIPGVGSVVGAAASAVNSFVVDPIAERNTPRLFVEQLKQLDASPPTDV
jgi:hypothetical protein